MTTFVLARLVAAVHVRKIVYCLCSSRLVHYRCCVHLVLCVVVVGQSVVLGSIGMESDDGKVGQYSRRISTEHNMDNNNAQTSAYPNLNLIKSCNYLIPPITDIPNIKRQPSRQTTFPPTTIPPISSAFHRQRLYPADVPHPMLMPLKCLKRKQRSEKTPIPHEQKDEKYFEKRKRNNEAAKKSRDARKLREDRIALKAALLERENTILKSQIYALQEEVYALAQVLCLKNTAFSTTN